MSHLRRAAHHLFWPLALLCAGSGVAAQQGSETAIPHGRLQYGAFLGQFAADGTYSVQGDGWPPLAGNWALDGGTLELTWTDGTTGCTDAGRYRVERSGGELRLTAIEDVCRPRNMILNNSSWLPEGTVIEDPPREIRRTAAAKAPDLPEAAPSTGRWPGFRGPQASGVADGQNLPDTWNVETGENVLWKKDIPGLAHSSPVIWGNRIFIATAVSSKGEATFRPGLYGDGDAADDRHAHTFEVLALDKRTGETLWRKVATVAEPIDKRHIKSTYANASPATDGRIVVASFGSQGVFAYTVEGELLWHVDVGRLDLGAYDVPSYEWGPASSPILWNGTVYLQGDTQKDSFLLALDAVTGETKWLTERDELPSWGTPTVVTEGEKPELVTNGSHFIRGYDPATGEELWRLGGSSKITAPTPIAAEGKIVVTSGRAPERPIFVIRAGSRGDITLPAGETTSEAIAWSIQRRGSYMPTPIAYDSKLYVLANNGVFDAYDLHTGKQIYRQRLKHGGSGFSGSPVAADGKIYLPSEDGDILVVRAGDEFEQIAANEMGDLLMTSPAISDGVLFVKTTRSLFAIGAGD